VLFEIYNKLSQKDDIGDLVEKRYAESRLGDFAIAEKNYDLAKQHYDQALVIAKHAVEMAPNPYRQRDLIASLQNVGDVFAGLKDDNKALRRIKPRLKRISACPRRNPPTFGCPTCPRSMRESATLNCGSGTPQKRSSLFRPPWKQRKSGQISTPKSGTRKTDLGSPIRESQGLTRSRGRIHKYALRSKAPGRFSPSLWRPIPTTRRRSETSTTCRKRSLSLAPKGPIDIERLVGDRDSALRRGPSH
jgi:hypothetical protein